MTTPVRTRFAPSPTGFLHIGGVRTALYAWLYARRYGGQFLLRIEDTDLERSEEKYTTDILASMKWLGLTWDEEPLYQSKRLEVYRERAEELIRRDLAYRCTCTEQDLERMRADATAAGKKPMYDRTCREKKHGAGEPHVIRVKLPLTGAVEFKDLIYGSIKVENTELDDFVLIRSNGAPTYNLSVVVDDVHSRMTHIIRGDDHINNTPKQIHLYQHFGYPVPHFAHLPMILGSDKKKLSKRHGSVSANAYRADGYLPEAILNFLVRLGWSHGDQEVFSVDEMKQLFDFDHCQKAAAVFNTEKLNWCNGVHMRAAKPERLQQIVCEDYAELFTAPGALEIARGPLGTRFVALIQPKVKLVREIADQMLPLCASGALELPPTEVSGLKWNKDPQLKANTQAAIREILEQWKAKVGGAKSLEAAGVDHQGVDQMLRPVGDKHGVKLGDFAQPIRLAVTGRLVSAGLFELLSMLPWSTIEPRLRKAAEL